MPWPFLYGVPPRRSYSTLRFKSSPGFSGADQVKVRFSYSGQRVRVEVADNGSGFDIKKTFQPDLRGGFGLYSIRERLRHVGGQLNIKSKPGQGTTVLITTPREIEK